MTEDEKSEELMAQLFWLATFISKTTTEHTASIMKHFPTYFQDTETQRRFYLDILCLYFDIYHRLGAGLIKEDSVYENVPSAEKIYERVRIIIGMCGGIIEQHSKKVPFMQGIDLELLADAHKKFYDWSIEFEKIYDVKNEISVKFAGEQIAGFSIKGENTLVINFIKKQIASLSIKEVDLGNFIFQLSDLIALYHAKAVKDVHYTNDN